MSIRLEVSREINARPGLVYSVIRDYNTHHARILPRPAFQSLVVEQGGVGEGTVARVVMRVMGTKQTLHLNVTEPEPGRVLKEEDAKAGVATTFSVSPIDDGKRSRVTIASEWADKPGLAGLVARFVNPRIVRPIYERELELLAAYAEKQ